MLERKPPAQAHELPFPAHMFELFSSFLAKDNALIYMPNILDINRTLNDQCPRNATCNAR